MYAVAVAGDIVGVGIDEPAEVVASLFLMAGLIVLTAATLNRELGLWTYARRARCRPSGRPPSGPRSCTAARSVPRTEAQPARATCTTQTVRGRPAEPSAGVTDADQVHRAGQHQRRGGRATPARPSASEPTCAWSEKCSASASPQCG